MRVQSLGPGHGDDRRGECVSITPPIRCNPAGEISWKVILRMKLSRFTPLHERAQPYVGSVWFVPEA